MNFDNKFDFVWGNSDGVEPSDELKEIGFQGGYKPPATVFNWFWRKTMKCITELQEKLVELKTSLQASIPENVSQLTNDAEYITSAAVPTNVSQLTNDAEYITSAAVPTKVSQLTNDSEYITMQGKNAGEESWVQNDTCSAAGGKSCALGKGTIATGYTQVVCGTYNKTADGNSSDVTHSQSEDVSLFIVGNGWSRQSNGVSNAFRVNAAGQSYGLKAFLSSGADFPEYFEWLDGNPDNEDRRGRFVTLDGKKIKLANSGDDYIVGVVSVRGGFIGNAASENWQGQYVKDVFGEWLTEQYEIPEQIDEETGEVTPAHIGTKYVVNPDYDPKQEYISREFRKEWSPVGLLGQVIVVDDGTCQVNGYCRPSIDGIATAAENGYRVIERIDDTHIEVLIK